MFKFKKNHMILKVPSNMQFSSFSAMMQDNTDRNGIGSLKPEGRLIPV